MINEQNQDQSILNDPSVSKEAIPVLSWEQVETQVYDAEDKSIAFFETMARIWAITPEQITPEVTEASKQAISAFMETFTAANEAFNLYLQSQHQAGLQPNELQATQQDFFKGFFHDVRNQILYVTGYTPMIESPRDSKMLEALQRLVVDAYHITKAFNLREAKMSDEPAKVSSLLKFISTKAATQNDQELWAKYTDVTQPQTQEATAATSQNIPDLKVQLLTDTDYEAYSQLETSLNIPNFMRLLSEIKINALKAYQASAQEGDVRPAVLDLAIAITDDRIVISFDDHGRGFPASQEPQQPILSQIDGQEIIPYTPKVGKTQWEGGVKGTGTGMASLQKDITALGGSLSMGTRVSDSGARIEVSMPIRPTTAATPQ